MGEIVSWKTDKTELDLEKAHRENKNVFKEFENKYTGEKTICDFLGLFKVYALPYWFKEVKEPNTYEPKDIKKPSRDYTLVTDRAQGEILTTTGKRKKIFLEGNFGQLNPESILDSLHKDGYVSFDYEYINNFKPGGFDCAVTVLGNIYETKKIPQEEIDIGKLYAKIIDSLTGVDEIKHVRIERPNIFQKMHDEKTENLMVKYKDVLKTAVEKFFSNKDEKNYNKLRSEGKSVEEIKNSRKPLINRFNEFAGRFKQYYEEINLQKQEKEEMSNDFEISL